MKSGKTTSGSEPYTIGEIVSLKNKGEASAKRIALILGISSSLFFAVTFVLNRLMAVQGGHWIWTSSLRYYWTAILLFVLVLSKRKIRPVIDAIMKKPGQWFFWSTVGFGLFYGPLSFASAYGPSWLIAGTWQMTILAGLVVGPMIQNSGNSKGIHGKTLVFSLLILFGIFLMQIGHAQQVSWNDLMLGFLPVLVASFAYPIGNRKMMEITGGKLNALQRTFGMTIASLPFWIFLSFVGAGFQIYPTASQVNTTLIVAIFSGVIATVLFFKATDQVQKNDRALAAVEATQSTEILFALIGELFILNEAIPGVFSILGGAIVLVGLILHSLNK